MKSTAPPSRLFVVKWRSPQGTKTLNDVFRCMASGDVTRKETSSITENKTAQQPSRPARHNVRSCNSCNHITATFTGVAGEIIASKNRGAGVSVCNVLLSGVACPGIKTCRHLCDDLCPLEGIMTYRTSLIK